jgi:ribosome-binding factor A
MDPHRAERVSEALREELSEIVEYELSDPRLRSLTVTGVHVTPDLKHAHIQVAAVGGEEQAQEALEVLEHASSYLRRELASRLRLWRIPDLHFQSDEPGGPAARVEQLLERVRKNRKKEPEGGEK